MMHCKETNISYTEASTTTTTATITYRHPNAHAPHPAQAIVIHEEKGKWESGIMYYIDTLISFTSLSSGDGPIFSRICPILITYAPI